MLMEYFAIPIFVVTGVAFVVIGIAVAYLLSPRTRGEKTLTTYECGIEPFGGAWIRYSIHYYIYALIFIGFDVDILYLFPVALTYTKGKNAYEFYSLAVFILILALAITYAWGKGVFTWKRKV
jgi:NADH:ubiquinone oxidoreductase subunit 3 (subunit A)